MEYRVATVSFLNTIPLVDFFLDQDESGIALLRALPSQLTGMLVRGEADVAILPTAEILRGYSDGILAASGIGCRGAVDSVKVFTRGPLETINRIFADRGSRSSIALLQVYLAEKYHLKPEIVEVKPGPELIPHHGEALLVIGDRCFEYEKQCRMRNMRESNSFDLGELWWDWTGLPFVFAAWVLAPGFLSRHGVESANQIKALLLNARDHGLANLESIARREAQEGKLGVGGSADFSSVNYYFHHSLHYYMGEQELEGMKLFRELCFRHGFIPDLPFPKVI